MSSIHSDTVGKSRIEFFKCAYSAPLPLIIAPNRGAYLSKKGNRYVYSSVM